MEYKVISPFYLGKKFMSVGETLTADDILLEKLEKAKVIVPNTAPKPIIEKAIAPVVENTTVNYESMTKNELVKLLAKRGIDFNKRQPKEELIALLVGGK